MASDKEEYIISVKDLASQALKTVGVNADKASGSLSRVEGSSRKAGSGIQSAGMNIGSLVKGFIAMEAVGYVWDIFKNNIAGAGIQMEQTKISFEVMLGSAEKANKMIADLNQFGKVTPFEGTDLYENAKLLMNFGIEGEKVIPILGALGDVSGGNQEKLNSLSLAFGQMSSTGRLMGQDLNQMINAGFNPLQQISKTTGVSMAELKKRMEDGAISTDMVTQAFIDATSEGGQFFGMMDKQSQTTAGRWSTLKDTIQMSFTSLGESILPIFNNIIDNIVYSIGWIKENFMSFVDLFSPITEAMQPLFDAFSYMNELISANTEGANILGMVFDAIGVVFKLLAPLISFVAKLIGGALVIITKVVLAIIDLIAWIGKLFGYSGTKFKEPKKEDTTQYAKDLQAKKESLLSGKRPTFTTPEGKSSKVPGMKGAGSAASHTKPIQINITMQNMVGELNVISQNLREAAPQIKRVIMETLTDGLNDSQRLVR